VRAALISVLLGVVGIGAIVAVASTAGPPDGYARFSSSGVHVYRPTALDVVASGGSSVVLNARGAEGSVRIVKSPARGRGSLSSVGREALSSAGGGGVVRDASEDVTGADAAREVVVEDAAGRARRTAVVARRDEDLYVLTVSVRRGTPDSVLDAQTVADSFYLD
jgi:hypothetical protein